MLLDDRQSGAFMQIYADKRVQHAEVDRLQRPSSNTGGKATVANKYYMADHGGFMCNWKMTNTAGTLQATDHKDPQVILIRACWKNCV